jgi:hypothetical protein
MKCGRRLIRSLPIAIVILAVTRLAAVDATSPATTSASPALQRFLSITEPAGIQNKALRHLEAKCEGLKASAWMDVWTELDDRGVMQYLIVGEGGSEYIRNKVFRGALEGEQKIWASGAPDRAVITPANYVFEDRGPADGGLASLGIKPRRKDVLLVDGAIFLRATDGDLERLEGRLSKSPSFWVRRVDVVKRYARFGGVRMPVALESVANLLFAGRSTFHMTYDYETVNGLRVGNPQPRMLASARPN